MLPEAMQAAHGDNMAAFFYNPRTCDFLVMLLPIKVPNNHSQGIQNWEVDEAHAANV